LLACGDLGIQGCQPETGVEGWEQGVGIGPVSHQGEVIGALPVSLRGDEAIEFPRRVDISRQSGFKLGESVQDCCIIFGAGSAKAAARDRDFRPLGPAVEQRQAGGAADRPGLAGGIEKVLDIGGRQSGHARDRKTR